LSASFLSISIEAVVVVTIVTADVSEAETGVSEVIPLPLTDAVFIKPVITFARVHV